MPDLITHYMISYLITSKFFSKRKALFISLFGILPDVDALFRIHRSITHSILIATVVSILALTLTKKFNNKFNLYVVIIYVTYSTHIIMDLFTGYTPILWPITNLEYMVVFNLSGIVLANGLLVNPYIEIVSEPVNFNIQPEVSGFLISDTGIATFTGIVIILAIEELSKKIQSKPK